MRVRLTRLIAAVFVLAVILFGLAVPAAALDNTFTFDEFGMSVKFPKNFYVITRDTPRGDGVFEAVDLGYDETMTAFHAANIYLRAYDPDLTYHISLTVTSNENSEAVNNYAELTSAQRKTIVDALLSDESVSSATEVKRNNCIFIDSQRQMNVDDKTVYISQSGTIVNGLQIDLILQKEEDDISTDEAKALNSAVSSLSFANIKADSGPSFDWWRLALWAFLLIAISVTVSVIYKRHNEATKARMEARRIRRMSSNTTSQDEPEQEGAWQMTFEESLGYRDDEEFASRADADEMAGYDINVRERDPNKGVAFFEDGGDSIDDGSDYFDTYFKEPVEERTPLQRFFSAIGANLKIALTHTGYFLKNLFLKIVNGVKNLFNKLFKKK